MLAFATVEEALREVRFQELNLARGVPVDVDRLLEAALILADRRMDKNDEDLERKCKRLQDEVWGLEEKVADLELQLGELK